MPVFLPPITRRSFLRRVGVACASIIPARFLLGAQRRVNPHSWAVLADTHIAADAGRVERGVNMADHLQVVAKQLMSLPQIPAGTLIAGDCAFNTGEGSDYKHLSRLLQPLRESGIPQHLILGNHDNRERFLAAVTDLPIDLSPVKDKYVTMISSPRVNWLMLDSLETTNSTPG